MEERVVLLIVCIAGLACVLGLMVGSYSVAFLGEGLVLQITSRDMTPTLNVGDTILVQPVSSISAIHANYETGDIICFHNPSNPDELIVHRAVDWSSGGLLTRGDHTGSLDAWRITDEELVGKVVAVNSLPLIILTAMLLWIGITAALVIAVIVVSVSIVSKRRRLSQSAL
jgi:signal peptidase I